MAHRALYDKELQAVTKLLLLSILRLKPGAVRSKVSGFLSEIVMLPSSIFLSRILTRKKTMPLPAVVRVELPILQELEAAGGSGRKTDRGVIVGRARSELTESPPGMRRPERAAPSPFPLRPPVEGTARFSIAF